MFEKVVVIDGKGHLIGRLASVLAKELLNGQKVVVVRCEEIQISGSLFRNQLIFSKFLQHRGNTNPKRGPIHYRSPSRILWRTIRGMIPHKSKRGAAALERLKVFEGTPFPYDHMKRVVVPFALRVLRLKPGRKYCRLGDLASSVGWAHNGLIKKLEGKRMTYSAAHYLRKKQLAVLKKKAVANLAGKLGTSSPATEAKPVEKKAEKVEKKQEKKETKPAAPEKKSTSCREESSSREESRETRRKTCCQEGGRPQEGREARCCQERCSCEETCCQEERD